MGLRWWNEVDTATGDAKWVFESAEGREAGNRTDSRFFWIALYAQPAWWILLGVWSIVMFRFTWLTIIGTLDPVQERARGAMLFSGRAWGPAAYAKKRGKLMGAVVALILTVTNTLAFSRCDRFSNASSFASNAFQSSGIARNVAGSMFSRVFSR